MRRWYWGRLRMTLPLTGSTLHTGGGMLSSQSLSASTYSTDEHDVPDRRDKYENVEPGERQISWQSFVAQVLSNSSFSNLQLLMIKMLPGRQKTRQRCNSLLRRGTSLREELVGFELGFILQPHKSIMNASVAATLTGPKVPRYTSNVVMYVI